MVNRRIHGDNTDEGYNESAREGDLRSIPFRIQKSLRRLHAVDHRKPNGNKTGCEPEAEDKDHGKTFCDLSDGYRCEQNCQGCRARDNSTGYSQHDQSERTEGLVAGRVVMAVPMVIMGMVVCISMDVVPMAMVVSMIVSVPMVVVVMDMVRVIMVMVVVMVVAMVAVAVTEQMKMVVGGVHHADPPLSQHPETDAQDNNACHDPEIGMNLLFRQVAGRKFRKKPQEDDTEGMGERNDKAKNDGVDIPSSGTNQIGGHHRFPMSRLKRVCGTQKKGGDIDAKHPRTRYLHRTFP